MQKLANQTYKISSLSPTFLTTQHNKFPNRKSPKSSKIQPFMNSLISEDPQQNISSPKMKQNKHKTRCVSQDQIGIMQCNVFEKKIKLKKYSPFKKQLDQVATKNDKNDPLKSEEYKQEAKEESRNEGGISRLNFVQQYRLNLRKTVFNETKMMVKSKKSKANYSFQTLDSSKSNNLKHLIQTSQKLESKLSLHSQRQRQQKKASVDSLYKTITNHHKLPRIQPDYDELQVSKFPLIMRTKQDMNVNYSNLLSALNAREREIHQNSKGHRVAKNKINMRQVRVVSRDSSEKQELKPWETYADQFPQ